MTAPRVVVAVDGGGSKTDVAVLRLDGELLARRSGAGCSPHFVGLERSVAVVDDLVSDAVGDAAVAHAGLYLSGLDLPVEVADYRTALADLSWARGGLHVDNDVFALLRAGSDAADAAVVVCGTGINALGRRRDGEIARFAALGTISGDWGGGYGLGVEALWHAARAEDGRGPATSLVDAVCRTFAVADVASLTAQLHFGERAHPELAELAPAVVAAASAGDEVAQGLAQRQVDEVVAFVRAISARLGFTAGFDVVLGGGVLRAEHPSLHPPLLARLRAEHPGARVRTVRAAPVVGAALLALEQAGASAAAVDRARRALDDA